MNKTVRDTIRELTEHYIHNNTKFICQNISGVGGIQNTYPEELKNHLNTIEIPTSDCQNPGLAVGYSLYCPTIYCVRFAPFCWINLWPTIYSAMSKEIWGQKSKLMIRAINVNTGQVGPVATGSSKYLAISIPGIKVLSPMSPNEFIESYKIWEESDGPVYVEEARSSYDINYEFENKYCEGHCTIFAVGAVRPNVIQAVEILREKYNIHCGISHVWKLKPLELDKTSLHFLSRSEFGLVVEDGRIDCGVSQYIASSIYNSPDGWRYPTIYTLGLESRVAGFSKEKDVLPPTVQRVVDFVLEKVGR